LRIYDEVLSFHLYAIKQGYIAVDFYDGSIMFDFINKKTFLCDIEFYAKKPCINGWWVKFVEPMPRHRLISGT